MSAKAARPRAAGGPGAAGWGGKNMDNDGPGDSQTVKLSSLFEPVSDV